ncbi:MAG: hypothetical protein JW860_08325 [Sedimentisphaerales bacterium]|nr:hypothetical protein [Sedimentisphaerales bacterium]
MSISEHAMYFVGNRAGSIYNGSHHAGGCTQLWWESECPNGVKSEKLAALSKLMKADGAAIESVSSPTVNNDNGYVSLFKPGEFTLCEPGMIAYVDFVGGVYLPGHYRIRSQTSNGITLDLAYIASDLVNQVSIGGAFDHLQSAFDTIDNATGTTGSRTIYINRSEDISSGKLVCTITGEPGNGHVRIIGFKEAPGDMDRGGDYETEKIEIDGKGTLADDLVLMDSRKNIHWCNIYFHGTFGSDHDGVYLTGVTEGTEFNRCRFGNVDSALGGTPAKLLMQYCHIEDTLRVAPFTAFRQVTMLNNVIHIADNKFVGVAVNSTFIGNVFIGGIHGIIFGTDEDISLVHNNTFYNQSAAGIKYYKGYFIITNNIFVMSDVDTYAVIQGVNSLGQATVIGNNCAWSLSGPLTHPFYNSAENFSLDHQDSIFFDPRPADPDSDDFRVRATKTASAGRVDVNGYPSAIGAVGPAKVQHSPTLLNGSPISGTF